MYARLFKSDLLDIIEACVDGTLSAVGSGEWNRGFAAIVVMVLVYPDS